MTPDEVERKKALCQQIEVERNHAKFSQLLVELNELLEQKNERLDKSTPYQNLTRAGLMIRGDLGSDRRSTVKETVFAGHPEAGL